jgi:hypothetical protein
MRGPGSCQRAACGLLIGGALLAAVVVTKAVAGPTLPLPSARTRSVDPPACPLGTTPRPDWDRAIAGGIRERVVSHKKLAWERARGGTAAARPHLRARLEGWPRHLLADRATLPGDDTDFLRRIARDTWRGLAALTDRENGLPINNVRFPGGALTVPPASIGDYASATDIGVHLVALAAARALDLLPHDAAVARARRILDTLDRLQTHAGFFFNYYDTTALERTSNLISFVDTSWLVAGLIVLRGTFPELADPCSALIARMDFRFFYDRSRRLMSHGYYVTPGVHSPYHYGVLYTEARIGSLIAIGKGDVPEAHWFEMVRTYPSACGGQTMAPIGVRWKTVRGHRFAGGHYTWGGVPYVPSWGGSMFEALMPTLVIDEMRYAPRSLGRNGCAHATVQRRYTVETLGASAWGMSPATTPSGDGYGEYGIPVLGMRGYQPGVVTPHAVALALLVTPEPAVAMLRALATTYDLYGDFGFYDAVDPATGAVAHTYLSLDQAMLFIAVANRLCEGCIQGRFAADPIVQRVLPMLAAEDFFD